MLRFFGVSRVGDECHAWRQNKTRGVSVLLIFSFDFSFSFHFLSRFGRAGCEGAFRAMSDSYLV